MPQIGGIKLKALTADQLDDWLDERAEELTTRMLGLIHQILERAIRQAQARDKVRRNVASLVDLPEGQEGRPSKAMTLNQAVMLLEDRRSRDTPAGRLRGPVPPVRRPYRRSPSAPVGRGRPRSGHGGGVPLRPGQGRHQDPQEPPRPGAPHPGRPSAPHPSRPPGRRAARRGGVVAGTRPRVLPRRRHPTRPLARTKGVRQDHQGRKTRPQWTPRELRHSFVSILSAHDVRLEDISDLVGHSSTSVTETVYRHGSGPPSPRVRRP